MKTLRREVFTVLLSNLNHVQEVSSRIQLNSVKNVNIGCIEWTGQLDTDGYGQMSIFRNTMRVHRVSYVLNNGLVPKGKCVLHKCDNRKCLNPEHLFLGTSSENSKDRHNKDRDYHPGRGSLHHNSTLTEQDVLEIRTKNCSVNMYAERFNIHKETVRAIQKRRSWTHI